jgi:hypothetical protein
MTRARLVVLLLIVLGGTACSSGGDNAAEGTTEPTTTEAATTEATTTEPAVEPLTDEERAWASKIKKIQPRIDNLFHRTRTLTSGTTQALIRTLRSCKSTFERAGGATVRFRSAAKVVRAACKRYETAARSVETFRSICVGTVGGVFAGSPEEKTCGRELDKAFTAQANGSRIMIQAVARINQISREIEAESAG